jgi:hypothetical protein
LRRIEKPYYLGKKKKRRSVRNGAWVNEWIKRRECWGITRKGWMFWYSDTDLCSALLQLFTLHCNV